MTFLWVALISLVLAVFLCALLDASRETSDAERLNFISEYAFPDLVKADLKRTHPEWSEEVHSLAWNGFREFCMAKVMSASMFKKEHQSLGMPSHVADEAWHTFMTHPKEYAHFCEKALGELLNHTPDLTAKPQTIQSVDGVGRATRVTYASIAELYKTQKEKVLQGRRQDGLFPSASYGISGVALLSVPLLFTVDAQASASGSVNTSEVWIYPESVTQSLSSMSLDDILSKRQDDASSGGCGAPVTCGGVSSCGCGSGSSCSGGSSCGGGGCGS